MCAHWEGCGRACGVRIEYGGNMGAENKNLGPEKKAHIRYRKG